MKFYVSRQHYWHSGELVVEIAAGGLDYANADMLCTRFRKLGEGEEYQDPREALKAALAVRDAWNELLRADGRELARVETGFTHGCTIPFEEYPTDEQLHAWAEKRWEDTPKCDWCAGARDDDKYHYLPDFGRECGKYCSEFCADAAYGDALVQIQRDDR